MMQKYGMRLHRRQRLSVTVLVNLTVAVSILFCYSDVTGQESKRPAALVTVVQPVQETITKSATYIGHVRPWREAIIYSRVAGYLESIDIDRGSWVKKNQILATIDDPEIRQRYQQLKAESEAAQIIYDRLLAAHKKNPDMVSQLEVDRAKGTSGAAEADQLRLRLLLDYTQIRAPFSGVITDRWVDPGALIQLATTSQGPSARIVRIISLDTVRVEVEIPEADVPYIRNGLTAQVTIPERPGETFQGMIARYSWSVNPSTRTMTAEIDVINTEHKITPGMFATVVVEFKAGAEVMTLPSEVFIVEDERYYVWIVSGGTVTRQPVVVINDNGIRAEVSGFQGTETIVYDGRHQLKEGQEVSIAASTVN